MDNFRHEIVLLRMEVRRMYLDNDDERTIDWSIEVDPTNENVFLLTGHLFNVGAFGIGQALGTLVIMDDLSPAERSSPDTYLKIADQQGWTEALYDACRRSIAVQASLMDFDPELPLKAPDYEVQVTEMETE